MKLTPTDPKDAALIIMVVGTAIVTLGYLLKAVGETWLLLMGRL